MGPLLCPIWGLCPSSRVELAELSVHREREPGPASLARPLPSHLGSRKRVPPPRAAGMTRVGSGTSFTLGS